MSIELGFGDGDTVECDWGPIYHPAARPDRPLGGVGELLLITKKYVERLLVDGPRVFHHARHSAWREGGRVFTRVEYAGCTWVWELFDAHWSDRYGPDPEMMVGRWPDAVRSSVA